MAASAGALKSGQEYAKAEHFFDWKYAQKVWFEMNTWEKEEQEWAKYAADFEPWLDLYKKDKRKALSDLKGYPETKRKNIQRGYDIQLAYDQWFDQVYSPWYNHYPYVASQAPVHKKKAPTFDDYLAASAKRQSCFPQVFLNECGPVPDWRSDKWKAKEQAMMAKADEEAARIAAKRKR